VLILAMLSACGGGSASSDYKVGGNIAGLIAPGLVLTNGSDSVSPAANASAFSFPTALPTGTSFDVSIKTQPSGLSCTVSNGTGAVRSANVTNVQVNCPSPWIWVAGSDTANATGVYGTMGAAAARNTPGARSASLSWTDTNGSLWLMGGEDSSGNLYNDLWEFAPTTGFWTWVSGGNTPNLAGVYGTRDVAAEGNVPGARASSATWIDGSGNLWLFGGYGYGSLVTNGYLNDLWKFSPSSGLWTWMGGANSVDSMGSYGTQGVAAAGNTPPGRAGSVWWRDSAGDFWLFGGGGPVPMVIEQSGTGLYNDLWKYNLQTALWTWIGGPNFGIADGTTAGVHGMRGVAALGNIPSPRSGAAGWIDSGDNLWLFGGQYSVTGTGTPFANDLWMYNVSSGLWTWTGGSAITNSDNVAAGVYGTEGTPSASNVPGARRGAVAWTDASGMFWLFGGDGEGSNPDVCCGSANDLWRYDPATSTWAWINGSMYDQMTPASVYGTQGVAAVGNVPGGRTDSAAWTDPVGSLWLFGGYGYASNGSTPSFSDLWRFNP
jgi:hypothetical protein